MKLTNCTVGDEWPGVFLKTGCEVRFRGYANDGVDSLYIGIFFSDRLLYTLSKVLLAFYWIILETEASLHFKKVVSEALKVRNLSWVR